MTTSRRRQSTRLGRRRATTTSTAIVTSRTAAIALLVSMAFVKGLALVPPLRRGPTRALRTYLETLARPETYQSFVSFTTEPSSLSFDSTILSPEAKPWQPLFDLELPEGRCIGLRLEASNPSHPAGLSPEAIAHPQHWIHPLLHPEEVQYGVSQPSEPARHTFFLGRLAMREALRIAHTTSILKDSHGRPTVPKGYLGSISHKKTIGVALIASDLCPLPDTPKMGIGVDIEQTFTRRRSIGKKVLTERELVDLGHLKGVTQDEEVLLRFSLKESLYKAMHPLICQYVGFQEAEVTPHQDGTATVQWNLKSGAHERFGAVTAHWRRLDACECFLTSASVTLKD